MELLGRLMTAVAYIREQRIHVGRAAIERGSALEAEAITFE
jgi:hypothetical protein